MFQLLLGGSQPSTPPHARPHGRANNSGGLKNPPLQIEVHLYNIYEVE